MLTTRPAVVTAILRADAGIVQLRALADGETTPRNVYAYPNLTGPVAVGDRVTLNTTATSLGLGTGGVDFVMALENTERESTVFGNPSGDEHIVKLRYTPHQHAVRTVEMDAAYASTFDAAESLDGVPVVVCGLHSQIAPVAAGIKALQPLARVVYVMTDSAALPLAFSRLVGELRTANLIDATFTAGQAFGGEYECVTVASALIAARYIAEADAIIVAAGPGNAGTGTRFGFSSFEQGPLLTLAGQLGGSPVGVLRLSLADVRGRHYGVSHHSTTSLGRFAARCRVAFPTRPEAVDPVTYDEVFRTVSEGPIGARHEVVVADALPGLQLLAERGITIRSMGRGVADDPLFFHAAAAAGIVARLTS
jgi:hypothetical protein